MRRTYRRLLASIALCFCIGSVASGEPVSFDVRTAKSGNWSDPATWEKGQLPKAGQNVQVRPQHTVVYDIGSDDAIRVLHVAGTLSFSREKSTRLSAALIKIQPGEMCSLDGFVCAVHAAAEVKKTASTTPPSEKDTRDAGPFPAALELGTPEKPIPAGVTATIRLVHLEGMDPDSMPAIVTCGGRWDVHGAPMSRTWVKLGKTAERGDSTLTLAEPVTGWRVGDRIVITLSIVPENAGTDAKDPKTGETYKTLEEAEEHEIAAIDGATIKLKSPLGDRHSATVEGAAEVANLSRNVVIESANPQGIRGHTMYHRHSTGSISYGEFRHLGKKGILGKYPIHFHLVREGMRGGGVTGASIWGSENRWMAIHGTDYLLIRDCVGYKSVGHGYFLEDGTEQYNVLDRNLAIQAMRGKRLPDQALPFDANEGAGFWWANGRNTLTRNVACENNRYGFRFEIASIGRKPPAFPVKMPDGSTQEVDVRTIPFLRFEDNESHSEGLYSFFFGDDPAGSVGGTEKHPYIARNLRAWETHYALRPNLTHFLMEKLNVDGAAYGVYHPDYNAHVYRDIRVNRVGAEPINRGHDDESVQFGSFTYDGLTIENCSGMPLIQLSCTAPVEGLSGHFRKMKVIPGRARRDMAVVDLGVGPVLPENKLQKGVSYFFHDSAGGEGKALQVVSAKFPKLLNGSEPKAVPSFTGRKVVAAEVEKVEFPKLLDPVDDLPPATMITSIREQSGKLLVRGVAQDNGEIAKVEVNGQAASIVTQHAGLVDWQIELPSAKEITAHATDKAGNVEKMPAKVVR